MEKELNKTEIEAELADHSENMNRRIESMEEEVTSTFDDVLTWIKENPLKSLGGAVFLGILTGYLVSRRRSRSDELTRVQKNLMQHYLDTMEDRIERGMNEGLTRKQAIQEALDDNVPLIIYQADGGASDDEGSNRSLSFMLKTAFGFLLRELAEDFAHNLVAGARTAEK